MTDASASPMLALAEPVILRPAREDERAFIRKQWLWSYHHSPFGRAMEENTFQTAWGAVVAILLERSQVTMVCPADSPEATVYGWMCFEPEYSAPDGTTGPVLHYVFVAGKHRKFGYASTLLKTLPAKYHASHWTQEFGRMQRQWQEDNAIRSMKCFGDKCGEWLTVVNRNERGSYWQCLRKARRPDMTKEDNRRCAVEFSRPVGYEAPERPEVTIDLTRV